MREILKSFLAGANRRFDEFLTAKSKAPRQVRTEQENTRRGPDPSTGPRRFAFCRHGQKGDGGPGLACAVIVKRVDEQTRSKTSINELLRD